MIERAKRLASKAILWCFSLLGPEEEVLPPDHRCPTCGQRMRE